MKHLLLSTLCVALTGCAEFLATVNTTDVTKVTVTTTGIRIGKQETSETPELTLGRHQIEYYKVPTGLASTNSKAATDVQYVPSVAGSYEAFGKSALFGNAAVTTTLGVGDAGVATIIAGAHVPVNAGAGTAEASNAKLYSNPLVFGPTPAPIPNPGASNLPLSLPSSSGK